jgi:hypothetical protein
LIGEEPNLHADIYIEYKLDEISARLQHSFLQFFRRTAQETRIPKTAIKFLNLKDIRQKVVDLTVMPKLVTVVFQRFAEALLKNCTYIGSCFVDSTTSWFYLT